VCARARCAQAFNYSTVFLRANGMAADVVQAIAILMNVMNVFVTLLSVYLMDRAGRRALLLVSTAGMAAATCMLTVALQLPGRSYTTALSVTAVICFVATFGARRRRRARKVRI
jgi:MFS family permease